MRLTTIAGNQRNSRLPKTNKTGVMNVSWHRRAKKYVVRVCGQYCGVFGNMSDAIAARDRAYERFDCHPNHGRKAA